METVAATLTQHPALNAILKEAYLLRLRADGHRKTAIILDHEAERLERRAERLGVTHCNDALYFQMTSADRHSNPS